MQRLGVVLFGALLVALALLYLLGGSGDPEQAPDPLEQLLEEGRERRGGGPGSDGRGGAQPVLKSTGAPAGVRGGASQEPGGTLPDGERPGPTEVLVFSSETEAPLAGVSLETAEQKLGETDEHGTFEIPEVPPEGLAFRAVHAGYLPVTARADPRKPLEIALRPGIRVAGRVVRAGTRDDPGVAVVRVFDEDLQAEIAAFSTDETGKFEIAAVRPNRPFLLTVGLEGVVPLVKRLVLDTATDDLEVLVGEGGYLTGRVSTPDDVPVVGIEVRLLRAGEPVLEHRVRLEGESRAVAAQIAARVASTRTDAEGKYQFKGVALSEALEPVAIVKRRHVVRGKPVTFAEPGQTLERDLLVKAAASVRIRVEEQGGQPIGDADLDLRWAGGAWRVLPSDERKDGDLVLTDLSPGWLEVTATKPGAPTQVEKAELRVGSESRVTLTFPRAGKLEGTVRDKRGKPIWKAKVTWTAEQEVVEVRTEMDGKFLFQRLAQPKGRVVVTGRDLPVSAFAYEGQVVEQAEAGGPPLAIVLKDGTRVTGSFPELPEGNRVHSEMYPGTKYDRTTLVFDRDLHFARRGPPPKRGALFVFKTRGLPPLLRGEKKFDSEEVRDLGPLFFVATNPRKGRVLGEDGLPVWAAKVSLRASWSDASVRTDRSGDFLLPRLPRIRVRIVVEADGYPPNVVVLQSQSEFVPQTIRLRKTVEVRLGVLLANRRGAGKSTLLIRPLFDPVGGGKRVTLSETTNRYGRATLRLAPGKYEFEARGPGGKTAKRTVELTAQQRHFVDIALR